MTRVLLVTGARSLADDPAAERWARGLIREALDGVGLLIVGDATGPDAWAWEIATTMPVTERLYLSQWRYTGLLRIVDRHPERATRERADWWADGGVHPIDRLPAMVRHAKDYTARQWDVRVLALLDGRAHPRVTRDGTEHTAGLAERAGLAVTRETWRGEGT